MFLGADHPPCMLSISYSWEGSSRLRMNVWVCR